MSLNFTASAHKIDVGSNAVLDDMDDATYVFWVWLNNLTTAGRLYSKGVSPGFKSMEVLSTGGVSLDIDRATDAQKRANTANLPGFGSSKWSAIAISHDISGSSYKIYSGDLSTPFAEAGAYSVTTAGAGAAVSEASQNGIIGNRATGGAGFFFPGKIGRVSIFNRVLSLGELQIIQYRHQLLSGCVGLWFPGADGASTVADLSGNDNVGTITSAAVSDFLPLGKRRKGVHR